MALNPIHIRSDRQPGDLGLVVWLHGVGYAGESGNHFGNGFEGYVAKTIADYALCNKERGVIFFAERPATDGSIQTLGCAAMVDRSDDHIRRGQLRWVIILPTARGSGLGKRLIHATLDYARAQKFEEIVLETTTGLDAAMGIYEQLGFEVFNHDRRPLWDGDHDFIEMRLKL